MENTIHMTPSASWSIIILLALLVAAFLWVLRELEQRGAERAAALVAMATENASLEEAISQIESAGGSARGRHAANSVAPGETLAPVTPIKLGGHLYAVPAPVEPVAPELYDWAADEGFLAEPAVERELATV